MPKIPKIADPEGLVKEAKIELREVYQPVMNNRIAEIKEKIMNYNSTLVDKSIEIDLKIYIYELIDIISPDLDVICLNYLFELNEIPTLIDADDLGPRKYDILPVYTNKKCIKNEDLKKLFDNYGFEDGIDFYAKYDVVARKMKRVIYMLTPQSIKTCILGHPKAGVKYRKCYYHIEQCILGYDEYQQLCKQKNIKENNDIIKLMNNKLDILLKK